MEGISQGQLVQSLAPEYKLHTITERKRKKLMQILITMSTNGIQYPQGSGITLINQSDSYQNNISNLDSHPSEIMMNSGSCESDSKAWRTGHKIPEEHDISFKKPKLCRLVYKWL